MPGLIAGVLLALAAQQSPAVPTDSLEREQVHGDLGTQLDAQLTRFAEYGFWGSVLVARDGHVVLLKGYGLADAERPTPNTAATRFEMNSMTKMFTGMAILQLDAAGTLDVHDSIERYLGAFPPAKQGSTVEQLANHTSGLIVGGASLDLSSRAAFVNDVKRTPRESPAGERYRYSNAGFSLLAALIEVTSREGYEDYVSHHLFAPAGMRTAVFRDKVPGDDTRYARGYVGAPATLRRAPGNPYVWGTRGAGGIWSTVGDMYRWLVAVDRGAVLPDKERRLLFAPTQPPAEEAYGWHVDTTADGRQRIHKGGGSDEFASQLLYYPSEQVVIVWATNNLRQRWRQTLNRTLSAVAFGDSLPLLPAVARLPEGTLQASAGRYVARGDTLEFRAGNGYLYALANRLNVPSNVMFFPQNSTEFTGFNPTTGQQTHLHFGEDGLVTVHFADGRTVAATR